MSFYYVFENIQVFLILNFITSSESRLFHHKSCLKHESQGEFLDLRFKSINGKKTLSYKFWTIFSQYYTIKLGVKQLCLRIQYNSQTKRTQCFKKFVSSVGVALFVYCCLEFYQQSVGLEEAPTHTALSSKYVKATLFDIMSQKALPGCLTYFEILVNCQMLWQLQNS